MAIFSNQATLTYNSTTTNSNIAYGELLEVLTATKTAVEDSYTPGEPMTYVVSLCNTGTSPLAGLTVTDDLGGYLWNGTTVYPLTYTADSVLYYINGVLQPTPAVTVGPPLAISGLTIPAGANALLIYQAQANEYADPALEGTIVNTATVTGDGLSAPITASETVTGSIQADLSITKSISPAQVVDNERVTYTFVIQNTGNQPVAAADNAAVTDIFDPVLTNLTVTFNGTTWTEGSQFTYDEATGTFRTAAGQITVPSATYTRDPNTGAYVMTPGIATLTVTGTI